MKILHDPLTLLHDTHELLACKIIRAHECPERITAILDALEGTTHELVRIDSDLPDHSSPTPTVTVNDKTLLQLVHLKHDPAYLTHLRTCHTLWRSQSLIESHESVLPECFRLPSRHNAPPPTDIYSLPGYYAFDMSSGLSLGSWSSIYASARLSYLAAKQLAEYTGKDACVGVLTRPPGHHCDGKLAGGYCYINNCSVAVETIFSLRPGAKISILDLDLHHGNGTQDIYYDNANPCYVSIHGKDEYPYYTGFSTETGDGDGVGYNLNIPLPPGTTVDEYMPALETALEKVKEVETEYLIISLGFDTYRRDPLQCFLLRTEDYGKIAERIGEVGCKCLVMLEGGYFVEDLGANFKNFVDGLEVGTGAS